MSEKKQHHHGDLRRALIEASIDLMAEDGPRALSIRKAAARAGVSHAAPAYHFPTLAHLRTAVVAEGYRRFTASMTDEMDQADPAPQAQVIAACRGYYRFARAHPGLFEQMFSCEAYVHMTEESIAAGDAAYAVLAQIAHPYGDGSVEGQQMAEMRIWSAVQGFSSLSMSGNPMFGDIHALETVISSILPKLKQDQRSVP